MIKECEDISQLPGGLLQRALKGDRAAFKEIYYRYDRAVYSICLRMLNNKPEAQDILQESFISAFKNLGKYQGGRFDSWLKKIAVNKCLDALRKRKVAFLDLQDLPAEEEVEPDDGTDYTVDEIRHAVSLLPDGYRVVLSLFLFEEYSHKMIAEKLGISEGTSKSQYARARLKLQTIMQAERLNNGR